MHRYELRGITCCYAIVSVCMNYGIIPFLSAFQLRLIIFKPIHEKSNVYYTFLCSSHRLSDPFLYEWSWFSVEGT
jgi:hypothetical protein